MAKTKPSKRRAPILKDIPEIELEPGAWERFEKLVKSAAKMGHKGHAPEKPAAKRKTNAKRS